MTTIRSLMCPFDLPFDEAMFFDRCSLLLI